MFHQVRKIKSSAKSKRCYWCGEMIEKGSSKITTSGVFEGDFYFLSFHPECNYASEEWVSEYPSDMLPFEGEMKRGSIESKND